MDAGPKQPRKECLTLLSMSSRLIAKQGSQPKLRNNNHSDFPIPPLTHEMLPCRLFPIHPCHLGSKSCGHTAESPWMCNETPKPAFLYTNCPGKGLCSGQQLDPLTTADGCLLEPSLRRPHQHPACPANSPANSPAAHTPH